MNSVDPRAGAGLDNDRGRSNRGNFGLIGNRPHSRDYGYGNGYGWGGYGGNGGYRGYGYWGYPYYSYYG